MWSHVGCAYVDVESALDVILGSYAHEPGLRLTPQKASRLWGLGDARCQGMLDALVDVGFLRIGGDGAYVLAR